MYKASSSSYFLGANTPSGFYSLFSELHCPEEGWRLYILKGGPGTGKSTFMKKIAAVCDKKGLFCERIFCSSDPKSLDAVIIPSLKVSIADGTPPHTIEPVYPGVSEIIVDAGIFRDDKRLRENADEIISLTKENSLQHKKCVEFLLAAKSADNDTSSVVLPFLKIERLHKFSEKLADAKITSVSDGRGKLKKRFLSALTPEGVCVFRETFEKECENRIVLADPFGCASSMILKILSMRALDNGLDCIMCYCPMSPEFRPEHLMIPSLSLGFYTSNRIHPEDFSSSGHIDCLRFIDSDGLSRHKNRIAFNNRSRDEMLTAAIGKLENAKRIHDRLERLYIDAMDFDALNSYSEKIISDIFS